MMGIIAKAIRNLVLAGETHPVTHVPFDQQGFPIFESAADIDLPARLIGSEVSDTAQFRYATEQLWLETCLPRADPLGTAEPRPPYSSAVADRATNRGTIRRSVLSSHE
jgi:hypothetical protein